MTGEVREYLHREVSRRRRELVPYTTASALQESLRCALCGALLVLKQGPPKRYCSASCRKTAWRLFSDSPGVEVDRKRRSRATRKWHAKMKDTAC